MPSEHILLGEGDSVCEEAVLVVSRTAEYTDEDMVLTIVVMKPSMRQKVAVL